MDSSRSSTSATESRFQSHSMRVLFLTTDSREHFHQYSNPSPYFGTAPQGLLHGFASLVSSELSPSSFEIHVASCTQQPMSSPEKIAENIWFHSLHVPKWGWLKAGYLGCILAVRRLHKVLDPHLVHAQGTERDCAMSAVFCPSPRVLTIHGNLRSIRRTIGFRVGSPMWFQSFLEGYAVARFDGVICITNYTLREVQAEAKRVWLIPNAVDPAFSNIRNIRAAAASELSPECSSDGCPVILVVANIDNRKNQNGFIKALDSITDRRSFAVHFYGPCGNDAYGTEFRQLIRDRCWCSYKGMVGREELRKAFVSAAFLALPSLEDNCPMVVLEAQSAGLPVLASSVGGISELVQHEVTGLLVNPCDPMSLAGQTARMIDNPDLRRTLAQNALLHARRFESTVIAKSHLEVYRDLLTI